MNMIRQMYEYSVSKVCDIITADVAFIHRIPNITIPQNSGNSCVFYRVFSVGCVVSIPLTLYRPSADRFI